MSWLIVEKAGKDVKNKQNKQMKKEDQLNFMRRCMWLDRRNNPL
jgi:hypothetical protein